MANPLYFLFIIVRVGYYIEEIYKHVLIAWV